MIRALICLSLISSVAFAAGKEKYNTHFTNPVIDERITFETCAVTGALFGILTNQYGDVLCWGTMLNDAKRTIFVFKGKDRKTQDYFEQTEYKLTDAVGEQGGGFQEWTLKLKALDKDLNPASPARRSTLKVRSEWDYSEGSVVLRGKLPDSSSPFFAPIFSLSSIDEALEDFSSELGQQ